MHTTPVTNQQAFRIRLDNGTEANARWAHDINQDWVWDELLGFRIRFLLQETAGGTVNNFGAQLQYNLNGAGWNDVTSSSSVVRPRASANFADGDDTTQQLGSGTFITTNAGMDELGGSTANIALGPNNEFEVEFSCQLQSADVANGDSIQLRILDGTTALDNYTNTPTFLVTTAAPEIFPIRQQSNLLRM